MDGERKYEGVRSREGGIRVAVVKVNRELGAAGEGLGLARARWVALKAPTCISLPQKYQTLICFQTKNKHLGARVYAT